MELNSSILAEQIHQNLEVDISDQELIDVQDEPPAKTDLSYYTAAGKPLDCDLADLLTDPFTKKSRSADDQCTYVKVSCTGNNAGSVFNFVYFYYCSFHHAFGSAKLIFFIPAGAAFLYILMYLLSTTADEYLSPSLEFLTVKFGIPESLAGVTLLAFGNGAPDVFTAFGAAETSDKIGDADLVAPLCTLMGAALFLSTAVIGLSLNAAKDKSIKVTKAFFIRDIIFVMIVELYILVNMLTRGKIDLWGSLGFFAIYGIYVTLVVIQAKKMN